MAGGWPVELRVGSTGAGVFVGCGAGLGIVTPISLHSVPVLGQLAASLGSSLGSLNAATGGWATAARARVRALGVRHLDLGLGCGVMAGYGYGAGLMLSPTAQQRVAQGCRAAGRQLLARLPQPVQAALTQRQHGPAAAGAGAGADALQDLALLRQPGHAAPGAEPAGSIGGEGERPPNVGAAAHGQQRQRRQQDAEQVAELTRLVLKHQNQLSDLQQQVLALQAAVRAMDPATRACKGKG